jgi:hypothetical protein
MIRTIKHAGCEIIISNEEYAQNPRTEWDNMGTMVCFHNRYDLGDKEHGYDSRDFNGWGELEAKIVKDHDPALILPLYLYDHSGLTISTKPFSCKWDSGQIGFIFVSKTNARREFPLTSKHNKALSGIKRALVGAYGETPIHEESLKEIQAIIENSYFRQRISHSILEKIKDYIEGEVKTYDDYLTGSVYSYTVEKDGEVIGSCCGFYGDEETKDGSYMIKQAMEEAEAYVATPVPEEINKDQLVLDIGV